MNIVVNGKSETVVSGTTLADLIVASGGVPAADSRCKSRPLSAAPGDRTTSPTPIIDGVAAALNDEIVHQVCWSTTALRDGDRIEILHAVAGG